MGRPSKDLHVVIGVLLLQQLHDLSDAETVEALANQAARSIWRWSRHAAHMPWTSAPFPRTRVQTAISVRKRSLGQQGLALLAHLLGVRVRLSALIERLRRMGEGRSCSAELAVCRMFDGSSRMARPHVLGSRTSLSQRDTAHQATNAWIASSSVFTLRGAAHRVLADLAPNRPASARRTRRVLVPARYVLAIIASARLVSRL